VQLAQPVPSGRRLLLRLCLLAFFGGLLLLLSSRPAEAAERREPGLLDPVSTTLKATAREDDSFAGRATGSRSSTVGQVADAARHVVAPQPRPAAGGPFRRHPDRQAGRPGGNLPGPPGRAPGPVAGRVLPVIPGGLPPLPGPSGPGLAVPAGSGTRGSPAPFAGAEGTAAARPVPAAFQTLAAALLLLGLTGRGRARPDRSGVLSRSYLPLVSPA
jgi:hypothetical protein